MIGFSMFSKLSNARLSVWLLISLPLQIGFVANAVYPILCVNQNASRSPASLNVCYADVSLALASKPGRPDASQSTDRNVLLARLGPQSLHQKIHKTAHTRRQMP